MKLQRILTLATLSVAFCAPLAAHAGSAIEGDVTVSGNKAGKVSLKGGKGSVGIGPFKGGEIDFSAIANVNSVVVSGGSIKGTVNVTKNVASDVDIVGGSANVNSVVVQAK